MTTATRLQGGVDIILAKYDASGAHQWSKRLGNANSEFAYAVAADASGNVIMTGSFIGSVDFGGGPLTSGGAFRDIFLAKYASDGTHQWSTDFGTTSSMDEGHGVVVDPFGNVVLTGHFSSAVDFGIGNMLTQGGDDMFVAKFGSDPATGVGDLPTQNGLRLVAYPNPFNPETTLNYAIPSSGQVTVAVYDARGARVALLVDAGKPAGSYSVSWNGTDGRGMPVASGVYFASVTFSGATQSYKVVLTK